MSEHLDWLDREEADRIRGLTEEHNRQLVDDESFDEPSGAIAKFISRQRAIRW